MGRSLPGREAAAGSSSTPPAAAPRLLRRLWQPAVGLAVLALVLARIDRREALAVLSRANAALLGAAFALTVLAMVGVTALRWRTLLRAQGARPPLRSLALDYLVGYFYNMVLPGAIGGDVYRVLKLGSRIGDRSAALASVAAERVLGLIALLPVGALGIALTQAQMAGANEFLLFLALFSLGVVGGAGALAFFPGLRAWLARMLAPLLARAERVSLLRRWRVAERLARLGRALALVLDRPAALLAALALSLLSRLTWVAAAALTGQAIGVRLPFAAYMAALAITELVRMLPISLGGLGVREGTFVVLLAPLGVSGGNAFMLSALFYLMLTLLGVIGGVLYVALGLAVDRGPGERTGGTRCPPQERR